jgi:hypothetical protein
MRCRPPLAALFDPQFRPNLTPKQMLELGVFCGKYLTDCRDEFPPSWFARAKLSPNGRDCSLNNYGVDASQPLSEWRRKGWIQIGRWKAMRRHVAQVKQRCERGDGTCRPRQRQALLHWAYDSRRI